MESTPIKSPQNSEYTFEQAAENALKWCSANPGWQRICEIGNSDSLYQQFDDLPAKMRDYWNRNGGTCAWDVFGVRKCKVPFGFITGSGAFVGDINLVPIGHNMMMVFKTGLGTSANTQIKH